MGIYQYTLRKATKAVNIDGKFQQIPEFKFSYKHSRHLSDAVIDRKHRAAFDARDAHAGEDGLFLALDGEHVYLTGRASYSDDYAADDAHKVLIGKVERVGGRLYCVVQYTTEELARAATIAADAQKIIDDEAAFQARSRRLDAEYAERHGRAYK